MKLLFVHDQFGARGGAESNIFDTAVALKRRGHELGILHGPGTSSREDDWNELFSARYLMNGSAAVDHAIHTFRPKAVFVHKIADLGVIERLAKSSLPVARVVHDHDIYCMRGYKYHPLTRQVCNRGASAYCLFPCGASVSRDRSSSFPVKWISYTAKKREIQLNRQFRRMIVYSRYMKEQLLQNGFDDARIEIFSPLVSALDQKPASTFSDRNLIIFAGQIIRGKGVDVLLESLAQVRVPFECLIFGEGSHRAYCENLSEKLGLRDRVQFRGFVHPEEVARHYQEASAAVVSSVWPEPFGLVGPEAMRYGLPVVAFDVGGISEWLIDGINGFLVPRMDRAAFALRLEELLSNKTRARQLGQHGRELVTTRHDPAIHMATLEDMFDKMIQETGGKPTL